MSLSVCLSVCRWVSLYSFVCLSVNPDSLDPLSIRRPFFPVPVCPRQLDLSWLSGRLALGEPSASASPVTAHVPSSSSRAPRRRDATRPPTP